MTSRRQWGVVIGFVIIWVLGSGANLVYTSHVVNATRHQFAVQRAAQVRQGEVTEQKLCATLHRLAALKPPAGNPAANPSRGFDQQLHATLDELAPDIGCPP